MDRILETVIRVDVHDVPPMLLVEEVAQGNFNGYPVVLNRTIDSSKHFIIFNGKAFEIDMMNVMVAVLEQNKWDDKRKGEPTG